MRVGADIQSTCRKCGDVWHVVIAMNAGRIAKVECKDCGARHGYRALGGKAAPRKKGARRLPSKNAKPIVEADPNREKRPFKTTESYEPGDRVFHASFGEGVVQQKIGANKVEILFGSELKTLVQGRKS